MDKGQFGKSKDHRYEQARNPDVELGGTVRLSGSFLLDHEEELLNLVRHEGRLAEERNPRARVTRIDQNADGILVEVSEHHLALRIGKALASAYKGEHRCNFREGDQFAEVIWRRDDSPKGEAK